MTDNSANDSKSFYPNDVLINRIHNRQMWAGVALCTYILELFSGLHTRGKFCAMGTSFVTFFCFLVRQAPSEKGHHENTPI